MSQARAPKSKKPKRKKANKKPGTPMLIADIDTPLPRSARRGRRTV